MAPTTTPAADTTTFTFTFSIFDGEGGSAWPSHDRLELEAADLDEALDLVGDELTTNAAGCRPADGYRVGHAIVARLWEADGRCHTVSHTLTVEDLGVTKSDVRSWDAEASYVVTFETDGGEGAADVTVSVGEAHGAWFIRESDEAGGSDETTDEPFASEEDARAAAREWAEERDEGDGEDADAYIAARREAEVEEARSRASEDGDWAFGFLSPDGSTRVEQRFEERDDAQTLVEEWFKAVSDANPGTNILWHCMTHAVVLRRESDGSWVDASDEE